MISSDQISLQRDALRRLYAEGINLARRRQARVLISLTYPVPSLDPLNVLYYAQTLEIDRYFWSVPQRGFTLLGVGVAHAIEGNGTTRFTEASQAWQQLLAQAVIHNPADLPGTGPILMGGFTFDPLREDDNGMWQGYPDARLVLPKIVITRSGTSAWLTHNIIADAADDSSTLESDVRLAYDLLASEFDPHVNGARADATVDPIPLQLDDPEADLWMQEVSNVASLLQEGQLEKVVLARAVKVLSQNAFQPHEALRFLRSAYPDCFLFSFSRGERTFLGATPEQLIRLVDGEVETMCLAGSIQRGDSPAEDAALGKKLLNDAKERREHFLVLRSMQDGLADVCVDLQHAEEPTLLKLGNVQHLYTPVRARCREGYTVFDVLQRLHPTPAVGGTPREEAMAMIRDRETFHRGWYASPVGWLDARSDGEFAVALRSALLHGDEAVLFAGCGIMPSSDPVQEYNESCLKLRPMLVALGGQQ